MHDEFMLPHEQLAAIGIPTEMRDRVALQVLAAKYVALVESALKLADGEPIEIDLNRVSEILAMDHTTDPRESVMVVESTEEKDPRVYLRLATVDEKQKANRRYALARMGTRRN